MTTYAEQEKTCFICGEINVYKAIASTNRFGHSDLDTRPPEMERSTIHCWIQRCPSCSYCAPDISNGPEIATKVVKSDAYLKQRDDSSYPELANKFLCWAIIKEAKGDTGGAGWTAVQAAWACDDADEESAANESRRRAVSLFEKARSNGSSFANGSGVQEAILADLLRRSGQFDKVETVCQTGLEEGPEAMVKIILHFQQSLARRKDADCYTIAEAAEFADRE
jgi:hypothetical protein